ncbi:MAG: ABC transporter ATP-binding protein/permease [Treponema sp.]|nr:ABC transporter ATP-binding protein/permease [Treponema sp.]
MDYSKSSLKIFLSYYRPHLLLFVGDMICATVLALIDIVFPMLTRWAINELIPNGNLKIFAILIAALFLGFSLRKLCNWFIAYWGHQFGNYVEAQMRMDVFKKLESMNFAYFDKNRTGQLMSRVTTDLFDITELAHHGPEDVWVSVITLLGSCVLMFDIRWELAVMCLVFLPVNILLVLKSRKKLMSTSKKVKETTAEINSAIESSISGIRVTKVFTNEDYETRRFAYNNQRFIKAKQSRFKYMADFMSSVEYAGNLMSLLVLAAGGFFIMKGKMNIADLVAANLFVAAFGVPIRKLSFFVESYTQGMAGFNRFVEVMRLENPIKDDENALDILSARGNITFENVDFSYTADYPVLTNVNLNIAAGEKQALVGSSGGGKTTICNLLPRFYEITGGRILLDGIDIRKIRQSSLRKQIGIVQQDVFLFAGTVGENIAYGKPGATQEEIEEAARRAEIHEDIMKMPQGYDTLVGERGIKLSGGQKQRVSIARCFLKNPPILILDEATSALDTATEIKIQHAFDELSKGRTTIVIAHRLSTIKNAHHIAVVDEKGIAENGTHEELLEKGGIYLKLCEAQFQMNSE